MAGGDWLLAQKTIPAAGVCNGAFVRVKKKIQNEDGELEAYDPQSQTTPKIPHL